jgi:beta-galactosidase
MPLEAKENAFFLDNKKIRLLSGAIHYFRVVPEHWEDRLSKLKACGLNCVETLVIFLLCSLSFY